jgi:hypothetical protein
MKGKTSLFWVGAVFTLVAPVTIGLLSRNPTTMWIAALSGAFVTLLTRIDDLTEIALGPVKAKMKVTLEEAAATIDQVRNLAVAVARVASTDLMAGGFMGSMTLEMRLDLRDELIAQLHALGLNKKQIEDATANSTRAIAIIYHRTIHHAIERRKVPHSVEGVPPELQEIGSRFEKLVQFDSWRVPSSDKVQKFVVANNVNTDEVKHWTSDYDHFMRTGEIRRRELFVKQ